jgi:hypothetical protein
MNGGQKDWIVTCPKCNLSLSAIYNAVTENSNEANQLAWSKQPGSGLVVGAVVIVFGILGLFVV